MRVRTVVLGMALLAASSASASDTAATEQEIRRVEADICRAFETGDAAALRRSLDPTFTLVDSHGVVTDYAQNLAEVEKRDPAYTVFRNRDQHVRVYGHSAVVVGITRVEGRSGDTAFASDFRYTDTYVKRAGGWTLVASHASRIAN